MSTTKTYGKTFMNACVKGTAPGTWVTKTAHKNGCTENYVWNCLKKEGYAWYKKFNGKNFWFPTFQFPCPNKQMKTFEWNFWQNTVEYCLQHGWVTPEQVHGWTCNQLFYYCCHKLGKQYSKPTGFKVTKKCTTPTYWFTGTPTKGTGKTHSGTHSYKYPTRTTTYKRKAA